MGFVDPKRDDDADEDLPGVSGLHLDLDLRRCPSCRRELTPWQERCPDCGETGVTAAQLPAVSFSLPDLPDEATTDDPSDEAGAADADPDRAG